MRKVAIKLKNSYELDGKKVDTLEMRPLKVKDMKLAFKQTEDDFERDVVLSSNLCDVPQAFIENLEWIDYRKVNEQLKDFLA